MPAGRGEEERFAAEVEYGSTPVPTGAGDGTEGFERELELVALLRSAGPALSPTPAARSHAKRAAHGRVRRRGELVGAELVGTELVGTELVGTELRHRTRHRTPGTPTVTPVRCRPSQRSPSRTPQRRHAEPTPLHARHGGRHSMPGEPDEPAADADLGPGVRRMRRSRSERPGHRRAALLGAAAAAALVALAGTGTFASQDALPGDPMYGVKRVAESTGYALTFGEQAKARRHLEQAQRRLDEVEGMVTRDQAARAGGAPVEPADQELVRSTMQEFDTDANEGSRLLLSGPADPAQVDDVRQWAAEQSARLEGCGRRSRRRTRPTSRSRCSTGCSARPRRRRRRATRPSDRAPRWSTASGRTTPRRPGPRSIPTAWCSAPPSHGRPHAAVDGDGDGPAADDDQATRSGSSDDDEPAENRNRDGSGDRGGSGGGDAAGSDDQCRSLSRCRSR